MATVIMWVDKETYIELIGFFDNIHVLDEEGGKKYIVFEMNEEDILTGLFRR